MGGLSVNRFKTLAAVCLALPGFVLAAETTGTTGTENAPVIVHAPVTTVVRDQPAHIIAEITPRDGLITSVTTRVKLALAGKPIEFIMKLGKDNKYEVELPVSLIKSINRFWYFIHVLDSKGHISDTIWFEVRIIDGADVGGGGPAPSHSALIFSGLILGGGALAAVIVNNNDDDGGSDDSDDPPSGPPTVVSNRSDSDDDDSDDDDSEEPECVLTGSEQVFYNNLDPFGKDGGFPIEVVICGACPNASVDATASWGASDSRDPYNNPSCSQSDITAILFLTKPKGFEGCESETITVRSNGQVIDTILWPDCSNF